MGSSRSGVSWLAVAATIAMAVGACAVAASVMVASGALAPWVLAAGGFVSLALGFLGMWLFVRQRDSHLWR